MPFAYNRNYKNMTEQQADQREQERVRVMLFGRNLISDRIIGRWSDGITGEELVKHLYGSPESKPNGVLILGPATEEGPRPIGSRWDRFIDTLGRIDTNDSGLVGDSIAENMDKMSRSILTPETIG